MPRRLSALLTSALLFAGHALAADSSCANKETGVKLNDYDIEIKQRSEVVEEIKAEVKAAGGTTDQHKQALEAFEQKLAAAKAERENLLAECNGK